ncbi:MAG: hypothetical protein IJA17_06140 [Oscillospiraceae bacterium]|nr:hypothetical protein [Oscillospiraceae bacterium]
MNGAEILHASEIVIGEILFCIYSATRKKHVSDTVLEGFSESNFKVQFIQIFKKTVFFVVLQSFEVIGHIIFNCILCSREKSISELRFIFELTKSIL